MLKLIKFLTVCLLLFNGIGAVYGGLNFILHPDGSTLGMSLAHLAYSPFSNYLIPGIVLLVVNGLLSLAIAALTLFGVKYYEPEIAAQGILLIGWLSIQVIFLRFVFILHIVMGAVGLLLIAAGIYLYIKNRKLS